MKDTMEKQWLSYLETPRTKEQPVKLDRILSERMESFLRTRKTKPFRKLRHAGE